MWLSRTRCRLHLLAAAFCAAACSGCIYWQTPRLEPTGESIYATPSTVAYTRPVLPSDPIGVTLAPRQTVAPVGTEVVMVAGVRGGDGFLRTNERLEWSIAPWGVGQFTHVQRNRWMAWLVGDFNEPRLVSNVIAVGSTSRETVELNRGPSMPDGCLRVVPGQGWITVTSPVEGVSRVAVYAPGVVPCDRRIAEAMIYWIDAQFGYPPPSINPAGSRHLLTTIVQRQSNQAPHAGWLVRYQITGGPPAGFAPDGETAVEVVTNAAGQASTKSSKNSRLPAPTRLPSR